MRKIYQSAKELANKSATKVAGVSVAAGSLFVSTSSHAILDTAPIVAAQTDMLAAAGALLTLGVAVWGAMKVVKMFGGK